MRFDPPTRLRQYLWFFGLWAMGICILSVVAYLLRGVLTIAAG